MEESKNTVRKVKKWEIFENDCFCYLNNNHSEVNVVFIKRGMSNSQCSDIHVFKSDKNIFNIETKMNKSQSSQFTLRIDDNKFIYSDLNQNKNNKYSEEIINYINSNYNIYKNVSQSNIKINIDNRVSTKWIKSHYKSSNTKFIITGTKDSKIILPIESIDKYFNIECILRRKKSGSTKLPKSDVHIIQEYIKTNISGSFDIFSINKDFYIEFDNEIKKDLKFKINNNSYLISVCDDKKIGKIRKLSNINNPTVIFKLNLYNNHQCKNDLNKFIKNINN